MEQCRRLPRSTTLPVKPIFDIKCIITYSIGIESFKQINCLLEEIGDFFLRSVTLKESVVAQCMTKK